MAGTKHEAATRLKVAWRVSHITREGGRTVIALRGEIDRRCRPILPDFVVTGLLADGHDVLIDLDEVTFVDLGAIRELHNERVFLATCGVDMKIKEPGRTARRMIHLCGLDEMIDQTVDLRTGRRPALRPTKKRAPSA